MASNLLPQHGRYEYSPITERKVTVGPVTNASLFASPRDIADYCYTLLTGSIPGDDSHVTVVTKI